MDDSSAPRLHISGALMKQFPIAKNLKVFVLGMSYKSSYFFNAVIKNGALNNG